MAALGALARHGCRILIVCHLVRLVLGAGNEGLGNTCLIFLKLGCFDRWLVAET